MSSSSDVIDVVEKSSKDVVGRGVPNPEALIRMNFLSQAAALMAVVDGGPDLSRFYMKTMKDVAQKLVIRIDPKVKRMTCKACYSFLIPGINSNPIHVEKTNGTKRLLTTCRICNTIKAKVLKKPRRTQ